MRTENISPELSARFESCEVGAWLDMYSAAPPDFARRFQLEIVRAGDIVLTRCGCIPFIHFNCVMNLGVAGPASEHQLDDTLASYRDAGVRAFAILHNPHCQPATLPEWFEARKLRPRGYWERMYRDNNTQVNAVQPTQAGFYVEAVTQANAGEWAAFIDACYGLPTTPWLLALVARHGWHHYVLRRDTQIVAVRSMYIQGDGMAWFGIDAPIPGIMAPSYDLDARLCQAMVSDGLKMGAKYFVADIEAPSAAMDTPAYRYFGALGFKKAYARTLYGY